MSLTFEEYIAKSIAGDLPGHEAHIKMAPEVNGKPFRNFRPPADKNPKRSAVLIPLIKSENTSGDYDILLTLRSSKLNSHSGQISFPGGRIETGEEPRAAALREAFEEVGIPENLPKVTGAITDLYVPPSNSLIRPYVAFFDNRPALTLNPDEVVDSFYVSLSRLASGVDYKNEKRKIDGFDVDFPFWDVYSGTPLWGATAMILSELISLFTRFQVLVPIEL